MFGKIYGNLLFTLAVSLALIGVEPTHAAANDGLASDFGGFGVGGTIADAPLAINDTALLPDGTIIAVGVQNTTFAVARYGANGALDQTFGTNGLVVTPISTTQQRAAATGVVMQADGKIVIAGTVYGAGSSDVAVVRYTAAGVLDSSFDSDGKVTVDFDGGDDSAAAVALDGMERIVVGGSASLGGQRNFAALRLTGSGALDTTFDGNGKAIVDFGDDALVHDLLIQPRGEIVLAGQFDSEPAIVTAAAGEVIPYIALARLDDKGTLDVTFDGDGKLLDKFTEAGGASSVALYGKDKLVVAGTGSGNTFLLARYNGNGTPDTTFDGDGKLSTPMGSAAAADKVLLLPGGQIIVAGRSDGQLAFARYTTDGTLDPTFADDGKLFVNIPLPAAATTFGFVRTRDGRLLAAGGPFLARLFGDGTLDSGGRQLTAFGPDGTNSGAVATLAQPDGKIVSVGGRGPLGFEADLALTRHLPNGQPDPDFAGVGARLLGRADIYEEATAALLQPQDDKILIVGNTLRPNKEDRDLLLARVNPDGSPDSTCGDGGFAPTDIASGLDDVAQAVALQADGKILVAGMIRYPTQTHAFVLRLEADCATPDSTFNNGGLVELTNDTTAVDVLALPEGQIQLVGTMLDGGVFLTRFNANGSPDDSFGPPSARGKVVTRLKGGVANAAVLLPGGKILVGAAQFGGDKITTLLLRYTATGELDANFGTGGVVTVDLGLNGVPTALALRGNGAFALVGCYDVLASPPVALFSAEGVLDPAFGEGGKATITLGESTCLQDAVFSGERLIVGGNASNNGIFSFALAAFATTGQPPTLGFAPAQATVTEAATTATLTVQLSQTAAQTVTVQYAATGGSATNGVDYTLAAGTLAFTPGQTVQRISLPLTNDTTDEVDETVVVTLSSPSNATLGSNASFTLTITDDDPTPPGSPPPTPGPEPSKSVFLPLVRR